MNLNLICFTCLNICFIIKLLLFLGLIYFIKDFKLSYLVSNSNLLQYILVFLQAYSIIIFISFFTCLKNNLEQIYLEDQLTQNLDLSSICIIN